MAEAQDFAGVFKEELGTVRARRKNVGVYHPEHSHQRHLARFIEQRSQRGLLALEAPRRQATEAGEQVRWPLVADNEIEGEGKRDEVAPDQLVGLALSGGGIRSAATCLGAMQALDRSGLMRLVDYISSVSGGGYAAACLNANITGLRRETTEFPPATTANSTAASKDEPKKWPSPPPPGWLFPLSHERGIRETALFRYLRANAQFLVPRGQMLEYSFAPVMLLRGLFLNLWALLPVILCLSALTVALTAAYKWQGLESVQVLDITASLLGAMWVAFFVVSRPARNLLAKGHHSIAWAFILLTLGLGVAAASRFDPVAWRIGGILILVAVGAEICRQVKYTRKVKEGVSCYPLMEARADESKADLAPQPAIARESFRQAQAQAMLLTLTLLFVVFQPIAAKTVAAFRDDTSAGQWAALLAAGSFIAVWAGRFEKLPKVVREALLLLAATLAGPILLWGGSVHIAALVIKYGAIWPVSGGIHALALLGIAGLLWHLNDLFFYDANEVSPHSYYRDKLASTFLFSAHPRNAERVVPHPDLKLSQMDTAVAPFALINAALNFVDRDAYRGRGRNATFFTFSPTHIGSTEGGYAKTEDVEKANGRLRLSSAIAISGAAASANMGRNTNPAFRFLLGLVNVRLGYWLVNPQHVAETPGEFAWSFWRNGPRRPGAGNLIREMIGDLSTTRRFVNLSDGGHIENIGIYELVRRRCRVIIAIDAEQDDEMAFRALGDTVRFCRIDHAATIEIDVAAIRPKPNGFSERHYAIGRIDYGPNSDCGWLVYIKNSVTGHETTSIQKYMAIQPAFPHHSTGDQFFDEEQFEAYRELGFQMATQAFGEFHPKP